MAALALARPVGSRGTAPGLTNPEQHPLAWMPHRHERRFPPRDESEEGDAVGFVEILPDEVMLPAVARLGEYRDPPRVVRRRTPAHHDLRPRMRSVEVADGQIVEVMQAPGGALARGADPVLRPSRPPRADAPPLPAVVVPDLIGRSRPADVKLCPGHRAIRVAHGDISGRSGQESNPPRPAIPEHVPGSVGGEGHFAPGRPGIDIAASRLLRDARCGLVEDLGVEPAGSRPR